MRDGSNPEPARLGFPGRIRDCSGQDQLIFLACYQVANPVTVPAPADRSRGHGRSRSDELKGGTRCQGIGESLCSSCPSPWS